MAQRGKVKREDPVARFLPTMVQVPARGQRQIVLVDLATSTSGCRGCRPTGGPGTPSPLAGYTAEEPYDFLTTRCGPG